MITMSPGLRRREKAAIRAGRHGAGRLALGLTDEDHVVNELYENRRLAVSALVRTALRGLAASADRPVPAG
jgi:hypothetical protein